MSLKEEFKDKIVELPQEFHLTWSFLGTKTYEQLQAFHEKLMQEYVNIVDKQIVFDKMAWMRSFVNSRPIIYATISDANAQWLLKFWQSLRMEEWGPKRHINEFMPHITLAQLSPDVPDEEMNTFMKTYIFSGRVTVPIQSLWFFGKGSKEKVSMQIY